VLLDNIDNYDKRTPAFDAVRVVLGNGMLTSGGGFWRRQRRIAQPAFHGTEAELLAIGFAGAKIKPRRPQPRGHAILHHMTTLKNPQDAAIGFAAAVHRRLREFILQRALAIHPEAGRPEVVARRLGCPRALQSNIHEVGDLSGNAA
jgi:hypothetical protein